MIVYKFTSPSGKIYFGKTSKTIEERVRTHRLGRNNLIKHNKPLPRFYAAWKKYPIENWNKEIVEDVKTEQEANILETNLIKQFNTTNPKFGYNMAPGGNGGLIGTGQLGKYWNLSNQAKINISLGHKKLWCDKRDFLLQRIPKISGKNNYQYTGSVMTPWGSYDSLIEATKEGKILRKKGHLTLTDVRTLRKYIANLDKPTNKSGRRTPKLWRGKTPRELGFNRGNVNGTI